MMVGAPCLALDDIGSRSVINVFANSTSFRFAAGASGLCLRSTLCLPALRPQGGRPPQRKAAGRSAGRTAEYRFCGRQAASLRTLPRSAVAVAGPEPQHQRRARLVRPWHVKRTARLAGDCRPATRSAARLQASFDSIQRLHDGSKGGRRVMARPGSAGSGPTGSASVDPRRPGPQPCPLRSSAACANSADHSTLAPAPARGRSP